MTFRIYDSNNNYSGVVIAEKNETVIDEFSTSGPIEEFYDSNGIVFVILRRVKVDPA